MTTTAPEPRIIEVTRAEVAAAKLNIEMSRRLGRKPKPEIEAIAAAKPLHTLKR